MSPDERYVTADAEQWMAEAEADTFDFIASASTIQWFVDPRGFFRNAARLLKPGGRLICSTFVSGNLAELDALRPAPIIYHSSDEIYRMAAASFGNVSIEEEDIPVVFDSPRQALMHLKLTGVAGTAKSNIRNLLTSLPARPSLTYRALYIRAIKN